MARKKKEEKVEKIDINNDEKLIKENQEIKENENNSNEEFISDESKIKKNPGIRKAVRTLIFLFILLFIVDALSLYAYYKPDMSKFTGFFSSDNSVAKCKDKTPEGECSKDKPYYCYEGELLKKAYTCGCPKGYKIDFQDCKKID